MLSSMASALVPTAELEVAYIDGLICGGLRVSSEKLDGYRRQCVVERSGGGSERGGERVWCEEGGAGEALFIGREVLRGCRGCQQRRGNSGEQ
jgi:hypothetical protein